MYKRLFRFASRHWFKTLCAFFLIYMCFISEHSVWRIIRLHTQEDELRSEIKHYQDSIDSYQERINQVSVDNEQLERHARERLHMHRKNEDLYLFDD